ncbi:MAG: CvpA family protein, partial [Alphaproteobacteria bacterium]|nr:CvpA family protein [Alphaproteobacteria bacterium]
FVFGLVRGIALVSVIYLAATFAWNEDDLPEEIAEAKSLPLIKMGADFLAGLAPADTFPGRDNAGNRIDEAVEGLKESVQGAVEGVARDKLEEMADELDAEEKLRRLNEPEPDTATPEGDGAPALPPGELPPPPGYEEDERSDMQRLIENNQ